MIEINNRRKSETNCEFDPSGLEQTYDINPSQVVFEHVKNSDAAIRNCRRSTCNYTSSYDGINKVLRLLHDHFAVIAIAKDYFLGQYASKSGT